MSLPLRQPTGSPDDEKRPASEDREHTAARREHALSSLVELSRELRVSLDLHETADLLLFNLMGQIGSARAALWLLPEEDGAPPVLVRVHGFSREVIEGVGARWNTCLRGRFAEHASPVLAWGLGSQLDAAAFNLLRQAEVALFAPLKAHDELLGWLALGERLDDSAYTSDDLQVVEAARGMVAVSMLNARLYNRARESNRALRVANEHLSELDRLKTDFLSNVNHELRTPLTIVLASLDLVVDRPNEDPRIARLMSTALDQARKLDTLIQNLLTFSEVTNAKLPFHVAPDDVASVLEACVVERRPGVTAGLRELVHEPPGRLPAGRFDRPRVRQILDELIDNAVKFTPRGSCITLSAEAVNVNGTAWVPIVVADNGPGIPPEKVSSLFRTFEQVDGSSTRTVGGLGMGLAFTRMLAERMGCRLEAVATSTGGATFKLWIPAA